ncbi:MAG: hypothetical protein J3R72DRAFT_433073 [Linnemannia gamsii]|nr:MAG: hypothetical protein J3R72DRAFT_433073 [Linnemannia gamsii]
MPKAPQQRMLLLWVPIHRSGQLREKGYLRLGILVLRSFSFGDVILAVVDPLRTTALVILPSLPFCIAYTYRAFWLATRLSLSSLTISTAYFLHPCQTGGFRFSRLSLFELIPRSIPVENLNKTRTE